MALVAQNRRARFDFEILETLEVGIKLTGPEVKSCRNGHVNLAGAYVSFLGGNATIKHLTISPYQQAAPSERPDPERERPLLLKKNEIERLQAMSAEKGIAIIPLEVHAAKYIKLLLGIGRGRKTIDKRQRIKERDTERNMRKGQQE